jgi:RluA family pseudouridine synthase
LPRFEHRVPGEPPRLRLDAYAAQVFSVLASRNQAKKALKSGALTLNGAPCESSRFVRAGDALALSVSDASRMPPMRMDLDVVHMDDWLAVVRKPAGIHVRGNHRRTVHRALRHNLGLAPALDALPDPDPVHRLDFRTSGLLLVARTAGVRQALCAMFQSRQIEKRYLALVHGRLEGAGEMSVPIGGRAALSHWRATAHHRSLHVGWLTTVDLKPETGRTHQLRKHLTGLGHPILGDDLHHCGKVYRGGGLFLCAVGLRFVHPVTKEECAIQIDPPAKFDTHCRREARRWERTHGVGA